MNRRNAFKAALAALALPFLPKTAEAKAETYMLTITADMAGVRDQFVTMQLALRLAAERIAQLDASESAEYFEKRFIGEALVSKRRVEIR